MAKKPDVDRDAEKEVIEYLNVKAGKKYRPVESNLLLVRHILAKGFTKEDCFDVIDNRVGYWSHDSQMEQYLRPVTLFRASKFEGYLNAKPYALPDRKPTKNEQSFDVIKNWGEKQKSREENDSRKLSKGDGGLQVFGRHKS